MNVNSELVCKFLAVFSRVEYSLKATIIYAIGNNNKVDSNWDKFANNINDSFLNKTYTDEELKKSMDYIINHPPRKQVLQNGQLKFIDSIIDDNQKKTQQTLLMVRRVRNNLFHGGKYYKNTNNRDVLLIKHSLKILLVCVKLDDDVDRLYS